MSESLKIHSARLGGEKERSAHVDGYDAHHKEVIHHLGSHKNKGHGGGCIGAPLPYDWIHYLGGRRMRRGVGCRIEGMVANQNVVLIL